MADEVDDDKDVSLIDNGENATSETGSHEHCEDEEERFFVATALAECNDFARE